MGSISLEAFDANLRGRISQWILPLQDSCCLPNGFYDQIISGSQAFQTSILLLSKQDSKAWHLAYPWELTFTPESPTDWSLLLSIIQHLKGPHLIVTSPKLQVPPAFWQKCLTMSKSPPTCVCLKDINDSPSQTSFLPYSIFFPKLDLITDTQFIKIPSVLPLAVQQSIQNLDLRSIYKELRGSGASLCLSLMDSRFGSSSNIGGINIQQNGPTSGFPSNGFPSNGFPSNGFPSNGFPSYNATWFYPEINGALRLHLSDLRHILRTVTERLYE